MSDLHPFVSVLHMADGRYFPVTIGGLYTNVTAIREAVEKNRWVRSVNGTYLNPKYVVSISPGIHNRDFKELKT